MALVQVVSLSLMQPGREGGIDGVATLIAGFQDDF